MATTPTFQLWYPDKTANVLPVSNDFPMMMASVEAALVKVRDGATAGATSATDSAVASAKSYTDTSVASAKSYTDSGVATAKAYTDSTAASTLASAKSYTDTSAASAKAYTDTGVVSSKSYADTTATSTLASAKAYADGSTSTVARSISLTRANPWLLKGLASNKPIAILGDSKAEGAGADSISGRWQNLLAGALQSKLPGTTWDTGDGFVPARFSSSATWMNGEVTISGTQGVDWDYVDTLGPGGRSVLLKKKGVTITFKAHDAKRLLAHFTADPVGGGSFNVTVNGALATSVTTRSGQAGPRAWLVGFVDNAVASRQATITCTEAGVTFGGISFLRETAGVRVADYSRAGSRADTYLQMDAQFAELAFLKPGLVIVALGANDMAGNFSTPITPEQWGQSLRALYDKIVAACPDAGVAFLHSAMRVEDARSASVNDFPEKLGRFEDAARAALKDCTKASLFFESQLWQPRNAAPANTGKPVEQDPLGWLADSLNPSPFGHKLIATHLAHNLTRNIV